MSKDIDIGNGFSYRFFSESNVEGSTGLIITGPAVPQCKYPSFQPHGLCGGGLHFSNSLSAQKSGRPMWKVESWEPLTISPSIKCACNGQHGHIRNGRYEPC